MLSKIRRLALFVLAMMVLVALVLASALLLRDPQLRPVFFLIVGMISLVTGSLGVALSMRRGLLAELGLGVMATTIGGIFLLLAQPWLLRGM